MRQKVAPKTTQVSFLQCFYISLTRSVIMNMTVFRLPRFYPILDVQTVRARGFAPAVAARQILDAGAEILQFRYKGSWTSEVLREVEIVQASCKQAGAIFVVNDRADIAQMIGKTIGAGVHLGQEDLRPSEVRRFLGADVVVGISTHNRAQVREALSEPADYVAFGPIFGTKSKENPDPVVGLDELRWTRALTDRPLVAIGGITRANARSVMEAGADSVAVIGDLYSGPDIRSGVREWLAILTPDS